MKLNVRYEHDIPVNAFRWTPKSYKEPLHYHASLEIGCCLSGRGTFYFGGKSFTAAPGDVFIVNNSELHIAESDPESPCEFVFVNFDPGLWQKEDEMLLLPFCYPSGEFLNHVPADSPLAKELEPLILRIWTELRDKPDGYRSMVKGLLLQLGASVLRRQAGLVSERRLTVQRSAFRELRTLLAYVEERFAEPLDLKDLAGRLGVSPSRASRAFREATGRGFAEYVRQLRLNEAKRQLVVTDKPITDVIFDSGFQSVPSFYRLFAASEGLSPADYRYALAPVAISENPER
ncbi:helix-turn-helix domain-containing protein [Cohnella suwonensis]|uniref:Helix-turn-helix domain-containing protein n=1 Tax=Cohnella suwonensis TaxID=696072 RepID=A0ABW0LXE3_9BACL